MQQAKIDWFNANNKIGIKNVITELVVRHSGWECDPLAWLVELTDGKKVFVTTNHGTPVLWSQQAVQDYYANVKKEANEYRLSLKEVFDLELKPRHSAPRTLPDNFYSIPPDFPVMRILADIMLTGTCERTLVIVDTVARASILKKLITTRPCDLYLASLDVKQRFETLQRITYIKNHVLITVRAHIPTVVQGYHKHKTKVVQAWYASPNSMHLKYLKTALPNAEFINSYEEPK